MTMMDIYFSFNVRFCYTSYTLQNKFIHFAYKVSEHELSFSSAPRVTNWCSRGTIVKITGTIVKITVHYRKYVLRS